MLETELPTWIFTKVFMNEFQIVLKVSSEETLQAAGIKTDNSRNLLVVQHVQSSARRRVKVKTTGGFARSGVNQNLATDLESTAESTSPTTTSGDYPTYNMPAPNNFLSNRTQEYPYYAGLIKQDTGENDFVTKCCG